MRSVRLRWLALILGALLVAEGASWVALRMLEQRRGLRYRTYDRLIDPWRDEIRTLIDAAGTPYQRIDPELGWVTVPGAVKRFTAVNQAGMRAEREYEQTPPPGIVRIAAFGDSYVHGDEVSTAQAWPARLERLQGGLEVLNTRLARATLTELVARIRRQGAAPLVVFFPDVTELDARHDGRPITYRPLLEALAADGVPVVDVLEGFDRRAPGWTTKQLLRRSHYSPWGNRLVAEILRDELVARGLLPRAPG